MPEVELFLDGFHFKEGMNFENYNIDHIEMSHHSVVRWNQYSYSYSIDLSWRGSGSPTQNLVNSLESYLINYLGGERVIRSDSGRPYKCTFFHSGPNWVVSPDMKSIKMEGEGYAIRIKESEVSAIHQSNAW